jgi:DNA-3-methyladenine glycosylase II
MSAVKTQAGGTRAARGRPASRPRFSFQPQGPFSLQSSARFLEGFAPAAHEQGGAEGHVHLAFVVDGVERSAAVCLRQEGERVVGEIVEGRAADRERIRTQVARILSLDIDGTGFAEVGRRDPVVGKLQKEFPGLRPVQFFSPYESAAWALISHRVRIVQAAKIKQRMSEELGRTFSFHDDHQVAFPVPGELAKLEAFPGLPDVKVSRLRELAAHAQTGALDAAHLRSLPVEDALAELRELPGIGPFSSELILLRGAGEPDHLPTQERRLRHAVALAYGLEDDPSQEQLEELAESWRPYRTWVCVLLRSWLEVTGQGIRRKT